jgi:hypothetical protein
MSPGKPHNFMSLQKNMRWSRQKEDELLGTGRQILVNTIFQASSLVCGTFFQPATTSLFKFLPMVQTH